ncbi:hypothetical protein AC791_04070 [Klebsiella sp. RIT-PI-d]|uniref:DUF6708 domain-containing protein n=1 Tax=Klebsiella sp. RIT-PI-d TaxID=1681196 RepID=UPI0006A16E48|nr:DUF6708 domain-containing protein [Klebsiella sp. RIT-PI-d]KNC11394.1 hypothetical protein AC791_04070 [Klebsiella sp. RIT-PI-d]
MSTLLNDNISREPILTPRLKNWRADLPANTEQQIILGKLIYVNEINDIWLEIPRYENIMWGGAWVGVISMVIPIIIIIYMTIATIFSKEFNIFVINEFIFISLLLFSIFILLSMIVLNLRMALFVPRDQPIRFNRKRQKVYVFEHHRKAWNPWAKWPTTIKVFDWADVHGELSRESDRYDQGFRLYGAVCQPGTHTVTERFIFSHATLYAAPQLQLWSHLCQYMQHKPVVMDPIYPGRPHNWAPRKGMFWPPALDAESRTAPE